MSQLRIRHLALLLAGLAIIGVYFLFWRESLLANLGAGLIVAFVLIIFVENAIERERAQERDRIRRVAMSLLRTPIDRVCNLLVRWYSASLTVNLTDRPTAFEDVFNEAYYSELKQFDLSTQAPVLPQASWLNFSNFELKRFEDALSDVIYRYGTFLDPGEIEVIEQFVDDQVISDVRRIAEFQLNISAAGMPFFSENATCYLFETDEMSRALSQCVTKFLSLYHLVTSAGVRLGGDEVLRLLDQRESDIETVKNIQRLRTLSTNPPSAPPGRGS